MSVSSRYARSAALYRSASEILPGGVPLGCTPLLPPGDAPLYFESGKGARVRDVDGNEYVDYVLAYGAIVLGYANDEVDAAAKAEIDRGMLLSMNAPLQVDFLRAVLRRFPHMGMGYFMKSGSEATMAAVRIARRYTGRRKVVRCGYHGWHDWCFPDDPSTPEGLAAQVLPLPQISADGLAALLERHRGEVAAVIVAPEMVLPLKGEVLHGLLDAAHAHGALFILDEIKTGLRCPGGSVQQHFGLRPDITTLSKALGNGWPVSSVIGRSEVMQAGEPIHLSATFHGETASMAAAMACMDVLERERVPERLDRLGRRFIEGLNEIARRRRVDAHACAEPLPCMPFLAFKDPDAARNGAVRHAFYRAMFDRGVLLHPRHLWYVAHAHTDADIESTLAAADEAMEIAGRSVR